MGRLDKIIENCEQNGHLVGPKEVAYTILRIELDDPQTAFSIIYGGNARYSDKFISTPDMTFLYEMMKYSNQSAKDNAAKEIKMSFDENREAMIKLIKETENAMGTGEIEKKDGLNIIKDIRVKLNDKFNVVDNSKSSMVIVEPKFNAVCECGREIYIPTKEDMIKKYNLTEK